MIINLIGPPASGKSLFASKFVLLHPEFTYCSIDEYRIKHNNEVKAWEEFMSQISNNKDVVMESMGLGWRLRHVFNSNRDRMIVTIAFTGEPQILHQRLDARQKRPVPFPYGRIDEHLSVDYAIEHLGESIAPISTIIDVTDKAPENVYEYLSSFIARKRIEELSFKGKNKEISIEETPKGIAEL